jgi:hypothetical protein
MTVERTQLVAINQTPVGQARHDEGGRGGCPSIDAMTLSTIIRRLRRLPGEASFLDIEDRAAMRRSY